MIRRLSLAAIAAVFAFGCATSSAPDAPAADASLPRYSSEAGSTPVGVIPDATLRDAKRDRDVGIYIDYPTTAGPHPLIIFSHALGGSGKSYVGLSSHWASNGYVVIKPSHYDTTKPADITSSDFANRVADIKFILDSIPLIEERFPELKGKIDTTRIGVGGHSLGALTAMLIGGVRTYPGPRSYADPRVKAVVAMSPPGPRESWGLTRESWTELRVPAMYMTGDRDQGIDESETPEWRKQAFELSPAGDKWFAMISGAGHLAFTGRLGVMPAEVGPVVTTPEMPDPTRGPVLNPAPVPATETRGRGPSPLGDPIRVVSGTIKAVSLMFWDAYLRNDAEGRKELEKGARGGVVIEKK